MQWDDDSDDDEPLYIEYMSEYKRLYLYVYCFKFNMIFDNNCF